MSELALEQSARHQIFVQRFAAYLSNQYDPYQERIKQVVNSFIVNLGDVTPNQLERELERLSQQQGEIYQEYLDYVIDELEQFAESEAEFQLEQVEEITQEPTPETLITSAVTGAWVGVMAQQMIFPKSNTVILLMDYIQDSKKAQTDRIVNAIRTGYVTNQSITDIVKQVTGKGSILSKKDKTNIRRMVITATNHTSVAARNETLKKRGVLGYEWVSVLDDRTSSICRSLDGQVFIYGKSDYFPLPPQHPFCRSGISPVFKDAKKTKQSDRPSQTGEVGAETTYYGWLKRQSAAFQDDVLGPTRGKLFRNGGLTSKEFAALNVDELFRPITLQQMKEKNPLAFNKANIDIK